MKLGLIALQTFAIMVSYLMLTIPVTHSLSIGSALGSEINLFNPLGFVNTFLQDMFDSLIPSVNAQVCDGDLNCDDDGCRVLNGIMRDCAYKIRAQAEHERGVHNREGDNYEKKNN